MQKNLAKVELNEVAVKETRKRRRGILPQALKATTETESSDELELLESCVLSSLLELKPDAVRRAGLVQEMYQEQYRRILRRDELLTRMAKLAGERCVALTQKERTRIVYTANCRPVGYQVKKKTHFCSNAVFCPWCFIRNRVLPARQWLAGLLPELSDSCCLLSWERQLDILRDPEPLFFRSQRGPANTFSARRHVQAAIVGYDEERGFYWRGMGFALIPKVTHEEVKTKVARLYGDMRTTLFAAERDQPVTRDKIHLCFSADLTIPVRPLYGPSGLETFMYLYGNRNRSKLFRKGGK